MKDRTAYFAEYVQRPEVKARRRMLRETAEMRAKARARNKRNRRKVEYRFRKKLREAGLAPEIVAAEFERFKERHPEGRT